jgi:hypothetical protein
MRSAWRTSPQEIDPLSWFAGPRLPLLFAIAAVVEGLAITIIFWQGWSSIVLQFAAMPFFLVAGWLTSVYSMPNRRQLGVREAVFALALASVGLVVSSIGTAHGSIPVQQWWPGIALAATLASLAPYSSALRMVFYSIPAIVVVAVDGRLVFGTLATFWPPLGLVVIAAGPVAVAAIASVVFCHSVVSRSLAFLDTSAADEQVYSASEVLESHEARLRMARVSARVAPFIESVANAGVITPADRALAAQIARTLRSELVVVTERSWLDTLAQTTGMVVSDPGRLADDMNESQRAALRGLLVVALDSSEVDQQTLLIELRAQEDGSTAVALSLDVDLPEGRRLRLLAPYYLTLKTTVDDLSWADGRSTQLNFRIPPRRP